MSTSPRPRSGTGGTRDIIIYEDEARGGDENLKHIVFDANAKSAEKLNSVGEEINHEADTLLDSDRKEYDLQISDTHTTDHPDSKRSSVVKSTGEDAGFAHGRNFSSNTAVHLRRDGRVSDPFVDEDVDEREIEDVFEYEDEHGERNFHDQYEHDYEDDEPLAYSDEVQLDQGGIHKSDPRKVSDFSSMPDELDFSLLPHAPTPPTWKERPTYRPSVSARNSSHNASRFLSSPPSTGARHFSPATMSHIKEGRFISSPLARDQQSPNFRNSSSMQENQMSSPSPPPAVLHNTPRSARRRRLDFEAASGSRNGSPAGNQGTYSSRVASNIGTPMTPPRSQHPNPQKEYPLVLLHCSFSSPILPYSPAVIRTVLPDSAQESLILLREKLGSTVMERGILIPHPGEDYELLEERVLESLELKTPRVAKCGHFLGSESGSRKSSAATETGREGQVPLSESSDEFDTLDSKCKTCHKNVADGHRGCKGDANKRWDIRVYASNGLMRAGAWATAWKEMEKVDIEIGVWLSEETRLVLERETQAEMDREMQETYFDRSPPPPEQVYQRQVSNASGSAPSRPRSAHGKNESIPAASTAPCSRPSTKRQASNSQRSREQQHRESLSTLSVRFLKRNLARRTDTRLHIIIAALALALFFQWQVKPSPPAIDDIASPKDVVMPTPAASLLQEIRPDPQPKSKAVLDTTIYHTEVVAVTRTEVRTETQTETITTGVSMSIPACTSSAVQEKEIDLTASPSDFASSILQEAQTVVSEKLAMPSPATIESVKEAVNEVVNKAADEPLSEAANKAKEDDVQAEPGPEPKLVREPQLVLQENGNDI